MFFIYRVCALSRTQAWCQAFATARPELLQPLPPGCLLGEIAEAGRQCPIHINRARSRGPTGHPWSRPPARLRALSVRTGQPQSSPWSTRDIWSYTRRRPARECCRLADVRPPSTSSLAFRPGHVGRCRPQTRPAPPHTALALVGATSGRWRLRPGSAPRRVTASAVMGRTWSSSTVSARQRQCQEEQRWPVWPGGRRRYRDRDQAADSRMLRAQRACRDCGERVTRTRVRDLRNERRPRRHAPAALGGNILSDFDIGAFARNDQRLLSVTARSGMRVPRAGRCGRSSVPHPICRTLCHRLAARP